MALVFSKAMLEGRVGGLDILGGPVAKTALSVEVAWVPSLVRELDPRYCN